MQAISLILVYAGSAAIALGLVSRFFRRIPLFWALALLLLPLVVTGRAMVTGGYFGPLNLAYGVSPLSSKGGPALHRSYGNGLLTDVAFQMVPWQASVRQAYREGRAPLWNPSIFCGDVLAGAGQSSPFHPGTVAGLLLPLATARTFAASLALFLGALAAFTFLCEIGLAPPAAFFGAAAWILSIHFLFWLGWPHAQSFAPMPFLFAGFRRIARGTPGGFGASAAAMALALLGGHPESAFHGAFAAGLYFLWEWGFAGRGLRPPALALGAGVLALALAAPAVLPVLDAVPQTREGQERLAAGRRTSDAAPEALRSAAGVAFPDWYGGWLATSSRSAPSFDSATAASVGGIALALAAFALGSPRREKWPLAVLAALTLAIAVGLPGIADLVNRLPVFRLALNNRLASVTAWCLAALAAIGFDALLRASARRLLVLPALAIGAAAVIAARVSTLSARGVDPSVLRRSGALFVAGILVLGLAAIALRRSPGVLAAAGLALFLAFRAAETPRPSPTFSSADFYPPIAELAALPRGGEPYRVVGVGDALVPNQSALYGLEDARGYEAITHARLVGTFPLWCVLQPIWFNRVDDPARPFLAFLNARFAIAEPSGAAPPGWRTVARGRSLAIFENPRVLPRAFAPRRIRFVPDPARTVEEMAKQSDFSQLGWIEAPGEAAREIDNGAATVRVREDGPDLVLDVDAAAPSWVLASETNWRGLRARENNTRFPVRFANHAFVGFRVPAGTHRVRLEYRPGSFSLGILIAAVAAVVVGVGAARRPPEDSRSRT